MTKALARRNFNFRLTSIFRLFQMFVIFCRSNPRNSQPSLDLPQKAALFIDGGVQVHTFSSPTIPSSSSKKSVRPLAIAINLFFLVFSRRHRWAMESLTVCRNVTRTLSEIEKRVVSSLNQMMPIYLPPRSSSFPLTYLT